MNIFATNSLIIIGVILLIGVIMAPIIQIAWMMRILIASYISLSLVLLMPDNFIFNAYASIIYFAGIVIIFTFIEGSRFFDVVGWSVGRFSFELMGFSILTVFFISAIICLFMSLAQLNFFVTKELYDFLNEYIFYIAIAPPIFSILFSRRFSFK